MPEDRDFHAVFGRPSQLHAHAPGRVNLIGEHTDYNGGAVLPMPLPLHTRVQLAARTDDMVRVWSDGFPDAMAEYRLGAEARANDWADYVRGTTRLLAAAGHSLPGLDMHVTSTVPVGSGLSSSAALEVAVMRALRGLLHLELTDLDIALLGQRVENEFVGARVGIMDQMASSLGEEGAALYINTATLRYERVAVPAACEIVVLDSGVKHAHAGGGYNQRRQECEHAAKLLGVRFLAELPSRDWPRLQALPAVLQRRARHVVTEHARVGDSVAMLRSGNLSSFGDLLYASHASLRDDFEVTVAQLDYLVDTAMEQRAVYGARMTGGGFGGSILIVARSGCAREVAHAVLGGYARAFPDCTGSLRVPTAAAQGMDVHG